MLVVRIIQGCVKTVKEYENFETMVSNFENNGFTVKEIKGMKNRYSFTTKQGNRAGDIVVLDASKYGY